MRSHDRVLEEVERCVDAIAAIGGMTRSEVIDALASEHSEVGLFFDDSVAYPGTVGADLLRHYFPGCEFPADSDDELEAHAMIARARVLDWLDLLMAVSR
jgi:hypothetical protein